MTQSDWDDERLGAAFRARFDRPAPPDIARTVHATIAGTSPSRFHAIETFQPRRFAMAAVVILLVGAATVALADIGRLGGRPSVPSGSGPVPTPGVDATPTAQAVPGLAFETLPIIQVRDAIAIRDTGTDDRELAVQGWFASMNASCPAPNVNAVNPLQVGCPDEFVWLMERAESVASRSGDMTTFRVPSGPALNPDMDDIDRSWEPADSGLDASGNSTPLDVVFVGHFDDRRAALCPEAEVDACRDRFVVDAVASVAGFPQPRTVVREVRPVGAVQGSSEADIEAIVANEAPDSPILSMVVTDGAEGLATREPSLTGGQQGLVTRPLVWVVRVLESERVVTYIVVDGTDAIYEMTPEGQAVQVGGSAGGPVPTPGPWPPEGAVIVPLTSEVGAGEPPVQAAVVDRSGRLVNVTEKGTIDPNTLSFEGRLAAYAEPGIPGRVHLAWVGGICDSRVTVTVAEDLGSITFDMGPQPANCDTIGVGRQLVLDFEGTVDVPGIELRDAADLPVPTEVVPAYDLDCGPLGPDTCEQRAADIVAANLPKRVVSIIFTDECGSFSALFDDGTGLGADADCILP